MVGKDLVTNATNNFPGHFVGRMLSLSAKMKEDTLHLCIPRNKMTSYLPYQTTTMALQPGWGDILMKLKVNGLGVMDPLGTLVLLVFLVLAARLQGTLRDHALHFGTRHHGIMQHVQQDFGRLNLFAKLI